MVTITFETYRFIQKLKESDIPERLEK